jgi:hypothetical protein
MTSCLGTIQSGKKPCGDVARASFRTPNIQPLTVSPGILGKGLSRIKTNAGNTSSDITFKFSDSPNQANSFVLADVSKNVVL